MARKILTDLDFVSVSRVTNLPAPAADNDAARRIDVTSAIEGLAWKDSVRVSTQGNINLALPGATIDGITMVSGNRFLPRLQTAAAENGIYVWNGAATPATRAADANTADELEQAVVAIEEGTNAGTSWRQTQVNFTLGTNDVLFVSFGTATPAASETVSGIAELATQGETDTGTDDFRIVTPLKLTTSPWAKRKFSALLGDGTATQYDHTHNFGTVQVVAQVFEASSGLEVMPDITRFSTNVVRLNFTVAPTANQYRVVIIG